MNKEPVVDAAEKLYLDLTEAGFEAVLDDRNERAGSKFKDAELMGAPVRIAIGSRGLESGLVEIKKRAGGDVENVPVDEVLAWIKEALA